jgi:hypothetical protein
MFDHGWISDLDEANACAWLSETSTELVEIETRQLALAAHWLVLHSPVPEPDADRIDAAGRIARALPGLERVVRSGAAGTPDIDEFACAEFAALQGMHPRAGATLLAKTANLVYRHPRLWARVRAGEVRAWKALETAKIVGRTDYALTREQAHWIDAETNEWVDSLPWGQFLALVEAKVIAADPEAAEARRQQAWVKQFVATGRSTEHGLRTLVARAAAGDIACLEATCDRIAAILAEHGDTSPVGVRRAKALGILANPATALLLLHNNTTTDPEPTTDTEPATEPEPTTDPAPETGSDGPVDAEPATDTAEPDPEPAADAEPESGSDAGDRPLNDTYGSDTDDRDDTAGDVAGDPAGPGDGPDRGPGGSAAGSGLACRSCAGTGRLSGDPAALVTALTRIDPTKLLPTATLSVHMSQHGFGTGTGVARIEDLGPVTVQTAVDLLGHRNIRLTGVLDLADRRPVDGYEFPASTREAIHTLMPRDAFPYAASTSRRVDIDHPDPYRWPAPGAPPEPGQTNTGNAAPMTRLHHRIKTHGRWRLRQLEPGTYLWRSPHGWYWLTGTTGTHPLSKLTGELLTHALDHHQATTHTGTTNT